MNITVNSSQLAQELRILNKIAATKSPLAVLSNVLFQASDTLRLSATNLEVGMHTPCKATINEPGAITLPAKKLLEIVDQLHDTDVSIILDKHQVKITSGSFRSRLQTLPASDFPALPEAEGEVAILSANALQRAIEHTSYAITDKSHIIKGALLSLNGSVMAMVATDAKRLSIITSSRPDGPNLSVVIPSKTLEVLDALTDDVEFSYSERHLFFVSGGRLLFSRMLDGKFPNYQRIIPRDCDRSLSVGRMALTAALRRVGVMAEDTQAVTMIISEGQMVLSSNSAGVGDGEEVVGITYTGETFKTTVHGGYLLDFLNHASEPSITIDTKEGGHLLLRDGPEFIKVVMTMKG